MADIPINAHPRRDIRAYVISRIAALSYDCDEPVYPTDDDFVAVETPSEEVMTGEGESSMGEITSRRLSIIITIRVRAIQLESTLDQIARAIEEELASDTTLDGRGIELRLQSTETEYQGEIEKPDGILTLTYSFMYAVDPRTFSDYLDVGA